MEISADHEITTSPSSVEVPIRAGTNWQNITNLGGTITFDTTVITYDQISYFGLTNPSGATFTYLGGGVLTYQWFSLISVGPSLSNGDIVFTIKFNAVGNVGDVSPVAFTNLPQNEYWNNGFGWSGGFASTNGSVTISCAPIGGGYTSAITGNTACFTDTTTGGIAWQWDFGDGNSSTQQNPCHTYTNPGNYTACMIVSDTCGNDTVCMIATNNCGIDSTCSTVVINCDLPSTDWSATSSGYDASFTDLSTQSPNSWLWDFGDGNTSTQQNPNHTYASPGTYTVCLTSTNGCGSDSTCYSVDIVCDSPVSAWTETTQGFDVTFTDQTTQGATSWLWDFGDGNTTTQQNPTHTYSSTGTYLVCLTATNSCGSDSSCLNVNISDAGIFEGELATVKVYPNPVENMLLVELPAEQGNLSIFDASNRLILQSETYGNVEIDTRDFAQGLYVIRVTIGTRRMTGRFVKK